MLSLPILFILIHFVISQSDLEYDLNKVEKFTCQNPLIDCSGYGTCSSQGDECICIDGYQTHFVNFSDYISNKPRCNYKSKKQLYALIAAMFISFGSLHFYLGNYIIGYIQLGVFLIIILCNTVLISKLSIKHLKKLNRSEIKNSFSLIIIMILLSLVFLFWFVFDLLMVFFNVYKDKNNAILSSFL